MLNIPIELQRTIIERIPYGSFLIDIDDVARCREHKWNIVNGYVETRINNKNVRLHRFLLNYNGADDIDHINRNRLDNRKQNLRIVPRCVNSANRSAQHIHPRSKGRYEVYFVRYGQKHYVGIFKTYEEALQARNDAYKDVDRNKEAFLREFDSKYKSKHTGIYTTPGGKYMAKYYKNHRSYYVGTYPTEEQAIQAREDAMEACCG